MKTILEVVAGSTLHGTAIADGSEDLDLMAVVLEDLKTFAGFSAKDNWLSRSQPEGRRSMAGDVDWVGYGLRRYLSLATKGNPTVLLPLFVPEGEFVTAITDEGRELRDLKNDIISNAVHPHFMGYLKGQRSRMETGRKELVERFGYDTKYAAHALRLGLQGRELLLTGTITLPMAEASRKVCLGMRAGGYSLVQALTMIAEVADDLELALPFSVLPREPNLAKIEEWMLDTYQTHWNTRG